MIVNEIGIFGKKLSYIRLILFTKLSEDITLKINGCKCYYSLYSYSSARAQSLRRRWLRADLLMGGSNSAASSLRDNSG